MRNKFTAVLVLLIAAMWCVGIRAQDPVPATKNYVAWAYEFLRAMYPDLSGKDYILTVETWDKYDNLGKPLKPLLIYVGKGPEFQVECCFGGYPGTAPPPKDFHPGPQHPEQVLKSGFQFDGHDRLESFGADGSGIGNPKVEIAFAKSVRLHQEWRDSEITAALKAAGAKYGPDDKEQFIRDLPIKKLEHFLGKLEIISVAFRPLDPVDENRNNIDTWPRWEVVARAKQTDGTEMNYKLRFERSKGDLINIWTVPSPLDPGPIK